MTIAALSHPREEGVLPPELAPRAEDVMLIVGLTKNITRAQFKSPDRRRRVARPRQMAMTLIRELTPLSLPQIGRIFGGRDHTTILHGIRRVARLTREDRAFAAEMFALRARLSQILRNGNGMRLEPGALQRQVRDAQAFGESCRLIGLAIPKLFPILPADPHSIVLREDRAVASPPLQPPATCREPTLPAFSSGDGA